MQRKGSKEEEGNFFPCICQADTVLYCCPRKITLSEKTFFTLVSVVSIQTTHEYIGAVELSLNQSTSLILSPLEEEEDRSGETAHGRLTVEPARPLTE